MNTFTRPPRPGAPHPTGPAGMRPRPQGPVSIQRVDNAPPPAQPGSERFASMDFEDPYADQKPVVAPQPVYYPPTVEPEPAPTRQPAADPKVGVQAAPMPQNMNPIFNRPPQSAPQPPRQPVVEEKPITEVYVEEPEPEVLDNVAKAKYVTKPQHPNAEYVRLDLPSLCVTYPFVDIHIRRFKIKDLSKIYRAMADESFSLMIDALGNTIDVDIRSLTPQDFNFLMYWHRLNSYPRSPFTVDWTSRYGNKNTTTVHSTDLTITELKMSREEYAAYCEYGLRAPTVRELEVTQTSKMEPDQEYLWQRAQFMPGNTIEEKLNALDEFADLEVEDVIAEFSEKFDHGVKESITVVDRHFNPETAPTYLRSQAEKIAAFLETPDAKDPRIDMVVAELRKKMDEFKTEADEIEKAVAEGTPVAPKEEDIQLSLNILKFFPSHK